jgi:hypothetical protein
MSGQGASEGVGALAIIHVDSTLVQFHEKLRAQFEPVMRKETAVPSVPNGVRASSLGVRWTKSRHSNAEGNCVEVAALTEGEVALRNSRDPHGPALIYTSTELAAFLIGAKEGEFDDLL